MFVLRAAFWVVLLSFVITGGNAEKAAKAKGSYAEIQHLASKVVAGVEGLPHVCTDHPGLCKSAHNVAEFGLGLANSALSALDQALSEKPHKHG